MKKNIIKILLLTMLLSGCSFLQSNNSTNYFDENLKLLSFEGISDTKPQTKNQVKRKNDALEKDNGVTLIKSSYFTVEAIVMNNKRDSFVDMVLYFSHNNKTVVYNEGNGDYQCSTTTELIDDMWVTKIVIDLEVFFYKNDESYLEIKEINFLRDGSDKKKAQIDGNEVSIVNYGFILPQNDEFYYNGFKMATNISGYECVIIEYTRQNTGDDIIIPDAIYDYYGKVINIDRVYNIITDKLWNMNREVFGAWTSDLKEYQKYDIDIYVPRHFNCTDSDSEYFSPFFERCYFTNIYYEGSHEEWFETKCNLAGILGNIYFTNENNEYYTLESIEISETKIPPYKYVNFKSLKNIYLKEGVEEIGAGAFWCCLSLENITFPSSLTSIGDSAFNYCSSLTSIEIPEGVTSIGHYAFAACDALSYIVIPASVEFVGSSAFSHADIYLEVNEIPVNWELGWNEYYDEEGYPHKNKVYLADQWEYDSNGIPVPLK